MLNPLVLDPAIAWTIQLDQQVALRVAAPGRARSLYPLSRLGRVVCGRHVQWQTEALLACLEAGVPVLFTDHRGASLAWCFGMRRREATLQELLRLALSQPQWAQWFEQWRAATARREIMACLHELDLPARDLNERAVRVQLCNWHRCRMGIGVGPHLHTLERAAAGVVGQGLGEAIGDAALLGYSREGLNLPCVVTGLLQWRLHRMLARTRLADLQHEAGEVPLASLRVWALRLIEGPGAPVHRALGEVLAELEQSLREWVL